MYGIYRTYTTFFFLSIKWSTHRLKILLTHFQLNTIISVRRKFYSYLNLLQKQNKCSQLVLTHHIIYDYLIKY